MSRFDQLPEHIQRMLRPQPLVSQHRKQIGLGDVVATVATPIARVMRLPCIDHATRQLRPTSFCAKNRKRLNKAVPNVNPFAQQPPPN